MKLSFGNESIDAHVVERGTFKSEKSGKELRELKVQFTLEGEDALDRHKALETYATKGVGFEETLWMGSVYVASWQQTSPEIGATFYNAVWLLREQE
jgi:hypothetical protein